MTRWRTAIERVQTGASRRGAAPAALAGDWAQADRRHLRAACLKALEGAAAAALDSAGRPGRPGRPAGPGRPWRPSRCANPPYCCWPAAWPGSPRRPAAGRWDPFVGREREGALITGAAAGSGPRVVLVTGPSGIGKSALLAEAAGQAEVPVLAAQAFGPDQDQAWSLAGRLLSQAARALPVPVAAFLPEPEAGALVQMVPGLAGPPGAALGLDDHDRRAFALRGAARLIAAMARPRCLIVADDLQWADPTSLTLLGLLLRRLDNVCLATACRPEPARLGSEEPDWPVRARGAGRSITSWSARRAAPRCDPPKRPGPAGYSDVVGDVGDREPLGPDLAVHDGIWKSRTIWMKAGSFSMPSSIVTNTTLSVTGTCENGLTSAALSVIGLTDGGGGAGAKGWRPYRRWSSSASTVVPVAMLVLVLNSLNLARITSAP